jgi:hypothetical protein
MAFKRNRLHPSTLPAKGCSGYGSYCDNALSGLIFAELSVGNVETAATLAGRILQRKHANPFDLVPAAASFAAAGRSADAENAVTQILRISPICTIGDWRTGMSEYRDRSAIDRFSNLLTQAGLPS